ncbi:MAG: acyltransferase [Burkholderiaceae bacterium]|nr:acyltransferase [Burkholderiaceae bacterium]
MSIYTREELQGLGLAGVGEDVRISRRASIYGASRIVIGDHVRIDDFCVLSAGEGGIEIGSYIHIAVYSSLIGAGRIAIHDFANISSRVSIYSSSDDYSGETMTNPMVPDEYKRVDHAPVVIGRHVIVGSGSIVLPGVTLHEGVAVGALSLVSRDVDPFTICAGVPAKPIKSRSRSLLDHERAFMAKQASSQ